MAARACEPHTHNSGRSALDSYNISLFSCSGCNQLFSSSERHGSVFSGRTSSAGCGHPSKKRIMMTRYKTDENNMRCIQQQQQQQCAAASFISASSLVCVRCSHCASIDWYTRRVWPALHLIAIHGIHYSGSKTVTQKLEQTRFRATNKREAGTRRNCKKKLAVHEKWRTWRFFCGLFCHFSVHVQVLVRHFRVLKSFLSKTRLNCRILPPFRSQEIVQCIIHASLLSHRRVTD